MSFLSRAIAFGMFPPFKTGYSFSPAGGGTDDGALIQAFFDSLDDGSRVQFMPGTYRILTAITCDKELYIDAAGCEFSIGANVAAFTFSAGYADIQPLTADYILGASDLTTSAFARAFRRGEPFKIISNAVDPANRDLGSAASQYRASEWGHAGAIAVEPVVGEDDPTSYSTTTHLQMRRPLRFPMGVSPVSVSGDEALIPAYTVALNTRVVQLTGKTMGWTGGTFYYDAGHGETGPWNGKPVVAIGYMRPRIRGIRVIRGYSAAVAIWGNYMPVVEDCLVSGLQNDPLQSQLGYGVSDASYMSSVNKCKFVEVRHGYTTGETTAALNETSALGILATGRIVGANITGCDAMGGTVSQFDTHHGAEDVTFTDCSVESCVGSAFSGRGRNIRYVRPRVRNCESGIKLITEFNGSAVNGDFWTAGKPDGYTTATISDADIECDGIPITAQSLRELRITGSNRFKSGSHSAIACLGSRVVVDGTIRHEVSDFGGTVSVVQEPSTAALLVQDASVTLLDMDWTPEIYFCNGSFVSIDAHLATDGGTSLTGIGSPGNKAVRADTTAYIVGDEMRLTSLISLWFQCTTAGTSAGSQPAAYTQALAIGDTVTDGTAVFTVHLNGRFVLEGDARIRLRLGAAYGWVLWSTNISQYICDPESLIEYTVDGRDGDDPTLNLLTQVKGKRMRVRAIDGTAFYDATGTPGSKEILLYNDSNVAVTHTGTGVANTNVYSPPEPGIIVFDEAGHFVRHEFVFLKSGTVGTATITGRMGGSFNWSVTMDDTDVMARVTVDIMARGENSQRVYAHAITMPTSGVLNPARSTMTAVNRTVDLDSFDYTVLNVLDKIGILAAVGDTITIDSIRIKGDCGGYGF